MTVILAKEKLSALGYELSEGDEVLLALAVERYETYVKHECRISEDSTLPKSLAAITADMAVGEFLKAKVALSPSDVETLSGLPVVKQISIGDTSTTYAVSEENAPEKRLCKFADYLIGSAKEGLSCYRKIHW